MLGKIATALTTALTPIQRNLDIDEGSTGMSENADIGIIPLLTRAGVTSQLRRSATPAEHVEGM